MTQEQADTIRRWYMGGCHSYRVIAERVGLTSGEVQAYIERGEVDAPPGPAVPEPEDIAPKRASGRIGQRPGYRHTDASRAKMRAGQRRRFEERLRLLEQLSAQVQVPPQ